MYVLSRHLGVYGPESGNVLMKFLQIVLAEEQGGCNVMDHSESDPTLLS